VGGVGSAIIGMLRVLFGLYEIFWQRVGLWASLIIGIYCCTVGFVISNRFCVQWSCVCYVQRWCVCVSICLVLCTCWCLLNNCGFEKSLQLGLVVVALFCNCGFQEQLRFC
jgi:hypothetical protein